jgi:hypothetical protein
VLECPPAVIINLSFKIATGAENLPAFILASSSYYKFSSIMKTFFNTISFTNPPTMKIFPSTVCTVVKHEGILVYESIFSFTKHCFLKSNK